MAAALIPERLETERLVLRRIEPEDRRAFVAIWADPDVWRSLIGDSPLNLGFAAERHAHQVSHWERHGFGLYLVEVGGEVAGWCGPWHPDFVPVLSDEVEIGWTLRRPFWGAGYATEAAGAAVDAAFAGLELERTISLIAPSNAPSRAVAQRLQMRKASEAVVPGSGTVLDVWELREAPSMP